jgi:hypothetical protein
MVGVEFPRFAKAYPADVIQLQQSVIRMAGCGMHRRNQEHRDAGEGADCEACAPDHMNGAFQPQLC